jgi:two-component system sensor histidine kinase DegS
MPSQAINLFRIIQEAVQNAISHSQGQLIQIVFHFDQEQKSFCVKVIDDGIGFDFKLQKVDETNQFGLKNMKKRAQEISGSLEFKKSDPRGTTVQICFPLQPSID